MKHISPILLLLILAACAGRPTAVVQTIKVTSEVTRIVETTVQVEVTRLIEVTRVVPEIMTVVVFPTAEPATPTIENTPIPTPAPTSTPQPTAPLARAYTSADVIAAFQAAGLEIGATTPIDPATEGGLVPKSYLEGTRFLIPSLGGDQGGRVFSFASTAERDMVFEYYQNLPLAGFSTWVSANGLLVLQINNLLPRDRWLEYEAVFQGLR